MGKQNIFSIQRVKEEDEDQSSSNVSIESSDLVQKINSISKYMTRENFYPKNDLKTHAF